MGNNILVENNNVLRIERHSDRRSIAN